MYTNYKVVAQGNMDQVHFQSLFRNDSSSLDGLFPVSPDTSDLLMSYCLHSE